MVNRIGNALSVTPDSLPELDNWARSIYLNEIGWQCEFAEFAFCLYEQDLATDPQDRFLIPSFAVHTLLSAFANLSKLFDPNRKQSKWYGDTDEVMSWRKLRAASLRSMFQVASNSPLMDRKMRNSFEHITEYLDRWIVVQPRPTADEIEATGYPARPAEPMAPLRRFDLKGNVVSFQEHSIDLNSIVSEVRRVFSILQTIEPALASQNRTLMAALTLLPAWPPELRLDAPSRRPNESVLEGVNLPTGPTLEEALTNAFELARSESDTEPVDGRPDS